MKRTSKQIKTEVDKLSKMKPTVRQYSMFGDDHHAAIDAQITVLKESMDDDDIYERYEDASNVLDAALRARNWLDGEDDLPSKDWLSLVSK